MELTIPCLNCGHNIPDRPTYYFCSNCSSQIRCKNCNELLEKGAKACSSCGSNTIDNGPINAAINNIEFEQKGDSRRFKANFTDLVGENLMHSLGGLFLGTSSIRPNQNPFTNNNKIIQAPNGTPPAKKALPAFEYGHEVQYNGEEVNTILANIFREENEELILINQRLKQTGKRDHAIRIALVALYGYSVIGKNQVSKQVINKMLQSAAVYDRNYLTWLGKCDEVKKIDSENLELNLPGRDAAIAILNEFIDSSIEKGAVHFSATSGAGKRGKGKKVKSEREGAEAGTGKSVSSRSSSSSPTKMIDTLIAEMYFAERRRAPEIIKYCKDMKGQTLTNDSIRMVLLRKIKDQSLKREVNPTDQQYEYFQ